jgi:hypothetical protein
MRADESGLSLFQDEFAHLFCLMKKRIEFAKVDVDILKKPGTKILLQVFLENSFSILNGFNANDVDTYYGFKTQLREYLARVKTVLDFIIGVEPKFLGEKVVIK